MVKRPTQPAARTTLPSPSIAAPAYTSSPNDGLRRINKRFKTSSRKTDTPRHDSTPAWLHAAALDFVQAAPPLDWTGDFYSWGTWLEQLSSLSLWTCSQTTQSNHTPSPLPPWPRLIETCRKSGQVCGMPALQRAKSDLVAIIIERAYRRAEAARTRRVDEISPDERDILRRVRAVITRQRRHEPQSLTLISFVDLAFTFSSYKQCRLSLASIQARSAVSDNVDAELRFLDVSPSACIIRTAASHMNAFMRRHRWLPWYERVPTVRDDMVIHARESALAFCDGLPYPRLSVRAGVRGLPRDHLAGAGSMNDWLISIMHPNFISKWTILADVYERAVREGRGEEDALLEETARRVVERVLEPLLDMHSALDPARSKLIDAAPGITITQSLRIPGRFTFRQMLELYMLLVTFGRYLHSTFYGCTLPAIEQIHGGIMLFEEIKWRVVEIRPLVEDIRAEQLFEWCLATTDTHSRDGHNSFPAYSACVSYQYSAIRAALGPSITLIPMKLGAEGVAVSEGDPLSYAATVAEWDAQLAANILDASVRINRSVRDRFQNGNGNGMDLYTFRRVTVCDASLDRFRGDKLAAARVLTRLHPVWDVCEKDKAFGDFNVHGIRSLQSAAELGNFEAASMLGILLCSDDWSETRKKCDLKRDVVTGVRLMCKSIAMGDTAAATGLLYLLQTKSHCRDLLSDVLIKDSVKCLQDAAKAEPALSLFVGYLFSLGAPGIAADCDMALAEYKRVLASSSTSTRYRAFAANNLGTLEALTKKYRRHIPDAPADSSGGQSGNSTAESLGDEANGSNDDSRGDGGTSTESDGLSVSFGEAENKFLSSIGNKNRVSSISATWIQSFNKMGPEDYLKIAASAGDVKAVSNHAALFCLNRVESNQDLGSARKVYEKLFNMCVGNTPVTVVQVDTEKRLLNVMEVAIRPDRQTLFCNELSPSGMDMERYGEIVNHECLPIVFVGSIAQTVNSR